MPTPSSPGSDHGHRAAPEAVGPGVYAVDSGYVRPGLGAVHIVHAGDAAYLVDTGTHVSVSRTLDALDALQISRDRVSHIVLTHIHLDHAGGAGALMQALPGARLVVHPRGARHMADPSRLIAGSIAVYGEDTFRALYGDILPIDPTRILETADGSTLQVGDRTLRFLHTPGHAKHHHCIVDAAAGGVFTGDTFGIAYRSLHTPTGPFLFPTTTPVHFDPVAARQSIERIVATGLSTAWLTHYSRVDGLADLAPQLLADLDTFVAIVERHDDAFAVQEALLDHLSARAAAMGHTGTEAERRATLAIDAQLNAQGLMVWKQARTAP